MRPHTAKREAEQSRAWALALLATGAGVVLLALAAVMTARVFHATSSPATTAPPSTHSESTP